MKYKKLLELAGRHFTSPKIKPRKKRLTKKELKAAALDDWNAFNVEEANK